MARKIKFPLDMGNNIKVHTMDMLKEHCNIEKLLSYFYDGRLATWLSDRFLDDKVEAIQKLKVTSHDFVEKLCLILEIDIQNDVISKQINDIYIHGQYTRLMRAIFTSSLMCNTQNVYKNTDFIEINERHTPEQMVEYVDNFFSDYVLRDEVKKYAIKEISGQYLDDIVYGLIETSSLENKDLPSIKLGVVFTYSQLYYYGTSGNCVIKYDDIDEMLCSVADKETPFKFYMKLKSSDNPVILELAPYSKYGNFHMNKIFTALSIIKNLDITNADVYGEMKKAIYQSYIFTFTMLDCGTNRLEYSVPNEEKKFIVNHLIDNNISLDNIEYVFFDNKHYVLMILTDKKLVLVQNEYPESNSTPITHTVDLSASIVLGCNLIGDAVKELSFYCYDLSSDNSNVPIFCFKMPENYTVIEQKLSYFISIVNALNSMRAY